MANLLGKQFSAMGLVSFYEYWSIAYYVQDLF